MSNKTGMIILAVVAIGIFIYFYGKNKNIPVCAGSSALPFTQGPTLTQLTGTAGTTI